jgi:predicted O-methyltransferase YrrM
VLSRANSVLSESAYTNDVIDLMYKLMEYRNQEIRHRLEKVGRAASMLHLDVLLLIYHFAKFGTGNILEIGPYIGGSTIAAAIGARESDTPKKIISVEAGGRLKHRRIPSRNIFKDLKKNLARFGVSESLTLINGYSFQETTISAIRQMFAHGEVGLFIFDADDNVRRTWIAMVICWPTVVGL